MNKLILLILSLLVGCNNSSLRNDFQILNGIEYGVIETYSKGIDISIRHISKMSVDEILEFGFCIFENEKLQNNKRIEYIKIEKLFYYRGGNIRPPKDNKQLFYISFRANSIRIYKGKNLKRSEVLKTIDLLKFNSNCN